MPSDVNGSYSLVSSYFVQNGDTILPVQHNPVFEDIAAGLTARLMSDGRTTLTGNLKMGTNRITGLADGTQTTDAAALGQVIRIDAEQSLTEGEKTQVLTNIGAVAVDGDEMDKLSGIEAGADVTDETNVTDALDGATLSAVTAANDDKVLIQDTSDSDNLKTTTVASILGGIVPGGYTQEEAISDPPGDTITVTDLSSTYNDLIAIFQNLAHDGGAVNRTLRLQVSENNGSSWSSNFNITTSVPPDSSPIAMTVIELQIVNLTGPKVLSISFGGIPSKQLLTGFGPINAVRFTLNSDDYDNGTSFYLYGLA